MNSFYSHLSAAIGTSVLLVNVVVAQEVQPPPPSPVMTEEQTFLYSQKLFEKGDFDQGEVSCDWPIWRASQLYPCNPRKKQTTI
jgi:hypothetical protein